MVPSVRRSCLRAAERRPRLTERRSSGVQRVNDTRTTTKSGRARTAARIARRRRFRTSSPSSACRIASASPSGRSLGIRKVTCSSSMTTVFALEVPRTCTNVSDAENSPHQPCDHEGGDQVRHVDLRNRGVVESVRGYARWHTVLDAPCATGRRKPESSERGHGVEVKAVSGPRSRSGRWFGTPHGLRRSPAGERVDRPTPSSLFRLESHPLTARDQFTRPNRRPARVSQLPA